MILSLFVFMVCVIDSLSNEQDLTDVVVECVVKIWRDLVLTRVRVCGWGSFVFLFFPPCVCVWIFGVLVGLNH